MVLESQLPPLPNVVQVKSAQNHHPGSGGGGGSQVLIEK